MSLKLAAFGTDPSRSTSDGRAAAAPRAIPGAQSGMSVWGLPQNAAGPRMLVRAGVLSVGLKEFGMTAVVLAAASLQVKACWQFC